MTADLVLVGGGLANGLIAWRLAQARPGLRLRLLERGRALGGNHTWSFHEHDLTPAQHAWIAPLVAHRWSCHDVRFPGFVRRMESGYHTVTSQRFDSRLRAALGDSVTTGVDVAAIEPTRVRLDGGGWIDAGAVVDGRGARRDARLVLGWQKFLGLELRLEARHDLDAPVLMDATVPQLDGFRFVYLLPFAPDTVLVEDTRYADGPSSDDAAARHRIHDYVRDRGWAVARVVREERGVLPIVLGGDPVAFWDADGDRTARSGMAAALFHPTTGYSLPDAVRLADRIATLPDLSAQALRAATRACSLEAWGRRGYFRMLNRMLFRGAEPDARRRVFEHFYRMPEPLIRRFYAATPTVADRLRLLAGRPPVPVGRALRAMREAA